VSCPLIIRPEAEADLVEGFDWYEQRRNGLGDEFLNEVQTRLGTIEENPLRYAAVYRNARQALVRRFPYKVLYLFEGNRVEVLGVVHVKRQPQFWQKRV
jgi:plasmid stabilization system protein ParE